MLLCVDGSFRLRSRFSRDRKAWSGCWPPLRQGFSRLRLDGLVFACFGTCALARVRRFRWRGLSRSRSCCLVTGSLFVGGAMAFRQWRSRGLVFGLGLDKGRRTHVLSCCDRSVLLGLVLGVGPLNGDCGVHNLLFLHVETFCASRRHFQP
ncbi:hypothetical protein NDU88_002319 [Pleurodeles waltl]|uniref:Transmembrane protein n=1 Tax=Pleurodeles waltl TaxID=8319 RepID=A0AAV7T208_PLEWA|nr:hypothetical protein NDU88_002319 [Pleurodeles waltl]